MIAKILGSVLDRVIPDTNQRRAAREELARMEQAGELDILRGQLDINRQEAAHPSLFVAGWRPAVGWICAAGLLYSAIVRDVLSVWMDLPPVDSAVLMPVLLGMLGLVGARSFEKVRQVSRERMR